LFSQLIDGCAGGRHLPFRFGDRGPRTGSPFGLDLLFEIVEPRARRL